MNWISLTTWYPWPGLAVFCFVHLFACLSKCNTWSTLQGIWKTLVLFYTGDDSKKSYSEKAACGRR